MSRYKITIEYDGTGLVGWQRQNNGLSVQAILEDAIFKFSNCKITVHGAGRTDAGVHALGQVAHFDLHTSHSLYSIQSAINYFSRPHKISIFDIEVAEERFHARFSCLTKTYVYKIYNRKAPLAIMRDYAWGIKEKLSIQSMREAAQILIGSHDFSTFRAASCQATSSIRTINSINIEEDNEVIAIYVTAQSFLHNQVRIIVGGLCNVGMDKWSITTMQEALQARDRTRGPLTAPAKGLFLLKVRY